MNTLGGGSLDLHKAGLTQTQGGMVNGSVPPYLVNRILWKAWL